MSDWVSREDRSCADATSISPTQGCPPSADQGPRHRPRRLTSSRGAGLLVALLAAFLLGPGGGSSALAAGGALSSLSPPSVAAGEGTARVVVSPDGNSAYATNTVSSSLSQYSRNAETGKLTALAPAAVTTGSTPEGVAVSPDGNYVYVANRNSGTVSEYSRNTGTGALTALKPASVPAGEGPIGLTVSPDGKDVYVANSVSETISEYSRNTGTGQLAALNPATAPAEKNVHGIIVSPDGKNVYAANYGTGKVAQYSRNTETGELAALSPATVTAGNNPHDLSISPDGKNVYVANNFNPGTVSQFTRNTETGKLAAMSPATVAAGEFTECTVVSPDGADVYATNEVSGNIFEYARNATTGALTALSSPTISTEALPEGIAVSPNGKNIYAANHGSGSVSQYARSVGPTVVTNPASGVTRTTATIAGSVNPNGQATTYHFEYGTTTGYGSTAPGPPEPSAGSGTSAQPESTSISGLAANTTYHFRIVATNPSGTSQGSDETFKTLPNAPTVVTKAASAVAQATATLNATVNPNGGEVSECKLEYAAAESYELTKTYGSNAPCTPPPGSGTGVVSVSAAVTGLTANTTYHFRVVATNAGGPSQGSDETFKTLPNAPAVVTKPASAITKVGATLNATVNPNGGEVTECKLEYGPTNTYGSSATCTPPPGSGTAAVSVSAAVTGLTANAPYHFRIVATNAGGTSQGSDETFKTLPNAPAVVTKPASAIAQATTTLNATVNPNGGEVGECKLEYGPTNTYGSSATCTPPPGSGTGVVSVSAAVTGLTANTTYHFRVVATNAGGTSMGSDETLKTLPNAPTVVTKPASAVTKVGATLNATVNPNGGEVGECKLEYGPTNTYGSSATCTPPPGSGTGVVSVSAAVTGLTANTTYHFRVVATNAGGTSMGSDETLKTLPNAPTVVTKPASAVTKVGATLNATVNPNGGEVSECKLEYGPTNTYGSSATCTPAPGSGTSQVSVSAAVTGLTANTPYHFRIVATNAGGTSQGSDELLKTLPNAPTVVTKPASAIAQTTTTLNATVNPNGGEVGECKLEYGPTNTYGSSATCTPAPGSGTSQVSVSAAVTGLTANAPYHFRVVATNAGGTSQGSDELLKTLPNAPTVVTKPASAIAQTTTTLNATVNPNGGEVGECKLEYGPTNTYGSSATCTPPPGSGTGVVSVSAAVTGLTANTTYHFRVVATNAGGTSMGSDETLKTLPNAPTVVTKPASAVTKVGATLNATVNPNGGEVSECKLEYAAAELYELTKMYGSSATCTPAPGSGTSQVSVSAAVTGLTANTPYHFRIVATNAGGTSQGSDETLKTLPNAPAVVTKPASAIAQTTTTLNATVNPNGGEVGECKLEYGPTNTYGSSATCTPAPGSGTGVVSVSAAVTGLTANTTYHFRVVATNAGGTSLGSDELLKTLPNAPAVVTKPASAITKVGATLNATVNPNGGEVSECKLEYGPTNTYGSSATCTPPPGSGTAAVSVSGAVTGLTANTPYHFRVVATNAGGTSQGSDETFKTLPNAPTVEPKPASAIAQTTATLNATVNPNGGEVSECKLEYGPTNTYGSSATCTPAPGSGTAPVSVSAAVTGLTANTTYHFRIVATNAGGTSMGSDETLKTLPNAPTVEPKPASAIAQTTATLNATVNPNGGEVSECKLEYGPTNTYGSSATCTPAPGSGTAPVSVSTAVTGLTANTTYHFRIVATNPGGPSQGSDETFSTLPNAPTVEAKAASAIAQTMATLNATVNPNGGEVTECKLEYGATSAYGSTATCTPAPGAGTSPVSVSAAVTGLTANTSYHFRVVATNLGGTSQGSDETLKTLPNAPTVETKAASATTQTTATLNATVNPNGGEVTECKLEYGATSAYGSSAPCTTSPGSGTSPVAVSASVTGLTANTTYHFRVVAGNAGGAGQGSDETVKTLGVATVVTGTASAIAQTTATLNATVNPNGGEVTECKLEYGATSAYGSTAPCTPSPGAGTSPVSVSAPITGLTANTTYHFRVVATNASGTSEGSDETLKTLPNPPTVETKAASAVTQTTATLNATVNPNGGEVTECKLEYGATNAYGASASCTTSPGSGTSPVSASASITGLTANTAYHFRVVATNSSGTSHGADETLTTPPNAPTVETKAASAATQTTATLNATVNPNGGEVTECKFEYGPAILYELTKTYGSSAPCTTSPGSGTTPVAVSAPVTGLFALITYDYRVVATNSGGSSQGADETLKTLGPPSVVTKPASSLNQTTATLNATVNPNGGEVTECKLEYGATSAYGSTAPCTPAPGAGTSPVSVSAPITGLTANTTSHFRVVATNASGTSEGSDETLKTLPNAPTIEPKAASAIARTTATLNATVNPNGSEVTECKLEYASAELYELTKTYGSSAPCAPAPGSGTSPVAVSAAVTDLTANTSYHFRISATNAGGTSTGADETLKTPPNPPTVETKVASAATQTTATLNATVNPNGGEVTECKLEYGATSAYGSTAPCTPAPGAGTSPVSVSAPITGLTANTTYHFRVVATNSSGTSEGSDETLKTLPNPPTVETKAASSATQTTATLNATVNPNGGEVTECKLEYGATNGYGSTAPCTTSPGTGTSPVAVSASVTGLTANTTYHFRISATNAGGTSTGADETLKTPPNPPTVETKAASAATQTTATLNATVNPNGGEVTECKLEYGATSGYGSTAPCTPSPGAGTSPVSVSAPITGLTANTTYHFRVVATNSSGTSEGSDETLKTLPNPPTVETKAASSATQTTATLNATVNPNGGEVTECKLEYGATNGYGSTAPCTTSPGTGTSPVAVSASVTGLTANTTYHFRISATNAGGTSTGADETLKTPPNPPTVETKAASAATQTTATLNATVNPNGGEVTECKLEYGATSGYGSTAPCTPSPGAGTSPVSVSAPITGLTANTTYHFRVVATNSSGTSEGSDETLKTLPNPPTVETKAASSATQTTATLNATVNPNGGEVTECKLEYGATNGYGSTAPCTTSPGTGTSPVAVSASVTGLTANTTYHFRISATNSSGTSEGSDETLKTLPNSPTVETKAASSATQTTATLNATVNPNGGEVTECKLEYGATNGYGSTAPCTTSPGTGTSPVSVSAAVTGLTANTTYHFRISATNAGGTSTGADETLKTPPNPPTVVTKPASSVTQTTATLNATVNPNGGEVTECKLEYGATSGYGSTAPCTPSPGAGTSPVSVSAPITGLTANTTYHFKVVATNSSGTSEGSDETLKTLPNAPTIEPKAASAIARTAATLNATVNPNGGEVTECKLEYASAELYELTKTYGSSAPCAPAPGSGTSPVAVSASITGLTANTTYHFRISATNAGGTSTGADETLKTPPNPPTVVTKPASSLTQTTATLNATVNPNGGEVTECKLEYGATSAYGSTAPCTPAPGLGTSPVSVSAPITGLTANTTYHFRVVATNSSGTSEGSDETLKTLPNPPTVETKAASSATQTTTTLNATVNPNGGEVTECKLEYGATSAYGSTAPCTPAPGLGPSPVSVSAAVTDLTANTSYHFRISATNAGGTSTGADETLKTPPNPPTVETKAASAATQTTATLNATVNPNGGEVTECKLEYGATSGYGSTAPCTPSPGAGTSPVSVSAPITGLTANTTYHFRVVATNSSGTSEGSDETLKTLPNPPTVETKAASSATQTTATLNATVNPNGGEVTECKLEYGATNGYGSTAPCTTSPGTGTSPVAVSASVTGLTANTTYHFRISATNAGGTSTGADETLKTPPNPPTVVTKPASSVTQTTATLNATVNPNGGEVTECKLEYGATNGYGASAPCTTPPGSGTSPVSVSAVVTGLISNTTYHFRISATNASGTSRGSDEAVKTSPNTAAVVTKPASAITQTTATLNATVNPKGSEVTECKLEYGTAELYELTKTYGSSAPCTPSPGSGTTPIAVSASVTGLTANTTYHFRVVATNAAGSSEGSDEMFKTLANPAAVETKAASAITQTAATLNATVNPHGGEVTECKFEYGPTTGYGQTATCTPSPGSGTSPVSVSAAVTGLTANTTYHVRISATNSGGTSEGSDETLKTPPNPPSVATKPASANTQTTVTLNATVNPNGGEVSECRLEYGTAEFYELTKTYGSNAPCTPSPGSGTTPVAVSASVTGLTVNTTYHFRVVATNSSGTSEGSDETFKTRANPAVVETKAASAITQTTATLNATVNPHGGEVTECKFEYGSTNSYGSTTPCTPAPGSGTTPVAVSASITGLTADTTYHFRIAATSSGGTILGSDETLKTAPNAPSVVTQPASAATQTTATLNATVNPNGGEVTVCKLEYGPTNSYGSSASCTAAPGSGTSPVAVSASITGLTANTTYHFRVVAANVSGSTEGNDETFKTLANPAAVVTKAASAITQTAATLNATVNPNGGEVTECKLEYGSTIAYGQSAPCTPSPGTGTTPVSVSASITGLTVNTGYHFRISATNSGGTSQGSDEALKTLPNQPAVETKPASAVTQTTATLNASVNPNGGEVTQCKIEYGSTIAYGQSAPCTPSPGTGTTPVSVSAAITGLTANSSYHFRISATNSGGTGKGSDEAFATPANVPTVLTGAASAVRSGTATLNATVNPNGASVTECKVEYGTTTAYESSAHCPSPGSGTSPVAVSVPVQGLTANTTYHFRISATSAGGTSKGSDETLITQLAPYWYKNAVKTEEGARLQDISWGTLSLNIVAGGTGEVTCHVVSAGNASNPVGGAAGRSETMVFAAYNCERVGICPEGATLAGQALPWSATLEQSAGHIRAKTEKVKLNVSCVGTGAAPPKFVGTFAPFFQTGTSALHPGVLEFGAGSGTLEGEGSGGALRAEVEGRLSVMGFEHEEVIAAE